MKGFVNEEGKKIIENAAAATQANVDAGKWKEATETWSHTKFVVSQVTGGVDFYNVLGKEPVNVKKMPNHMDLSVMSPNISKTVNLNINLFFDKFS